jgi:hypothetical protein
VLLPTRTLRTLVALKSDSGGCQESFASDFGGTF